MTDLVDIVLKSEVNVEQLADPRLLRSAAEEIGAVATEQGATYLLAASPEAERLVGAALVCSPHLRALSRRLAVGVGNEIVLVVDVNLASGTSLARAAKRARRSGAAQVTGAVLHAFDGSVGAGECQLDGLAVIDRQTRSIVGSRGSVVG